MVVSFQDGPVVGFKLGGTSAARPAFLFFEIYALHGCPFKVGASRLQLPKACYRLCNYKRECPLIRVAFSLEFVAE